MSRTPGLYKDFPPEFPGPLNYHVDENLSVGGFAAIWVIYYFLAFCATVVLAFVVARSTRGKPFGPGQKLIVFNLSSDVFRQLVIIFAMIFTGGDVAVLAPGGLAFVAWLVQTAGFMQIFSVIAMFHLRRKVMQDVEQLVSDRVYNANKYILVGVCVAVFSQTIIIFGTTPNWLFNQKWYVNGPVESDAKRILNPATTVSATGYDNVLYNILGVSNLLLALPIPLFYNLYCLVPVLRLLKKFRTKGICSAEMESMARLSITFYLIFVFFFMVQTFIGIALSLEADLGVSWMASVALTVPNMVSNVVACYIFFPRFRAYFVALCYDIIGKKDRAREREALVEREIEDYNNTTMTDGTDRDRTTVASTDSTTTRNTTTNTTNTTATTDNTTEMATM